MSHLEAASPRAARPRPAWRAVALPAEHGGWGLTAEAVLLGLLVRPSAAGAAVGCAAVLAFLARTPAKLAGVDRLRHRRLERSVLAERIAAAEVALLAGAIAFAAARAHPGWWVPLVASLPLFGVELAYDVRSRGRRLLPELCGAIGMSAVAAAIALAGGSRARLAAAVSVVLLARSLASVPYARAQVLRLRPKHGGEGRTAATVMQLAGAVAGVGASALQRAMWPASAAVGALAAWQLVEMHRPVASAKQVGMRQALAGLVLVAVTVVAVRLG